LHATIYRLHLVFIVISLIYYYIYKKMLLTEMKLF
jgi:hypothetical protein